MRRRKASVFLIHPERTPASIHFVRKDATQSMDLIQAKTYRSSYLGHQEELFIFVNGERLDYLLSAESGRNLLNLVPAWLRLDESDRLSDEPFNCLWNYFRLDIDHQIQPLLLCPEALSINHITARADQAEPVISGPAALVVVEISSDEGTVQWQRFGLGPAGAQIPRGDEIQWLDGPGPFIFDRQNYLDCLEIFKSRARAPHSPEANRLDRSADRPSFLYRLFALLGAFFGIGSGALKLDALAYRQVQYALEESENPPTWSFVRLMPVSGLAALGLDPTEKYLLALGQNGRAVFDVASGRRVSKDAGINLTAPGDPLTSTEGIGPLEGQTIAIWGPECGQAATDLMREAREVSNGLSAIKAALKADEGRLLIVGQADGVYLFERISEQDR